MEANGHTVGKMTADRLIHKVKQRNIIVDIDSALMECYLEILDLVLNVKVLLLYVGMASNTTAKWDGFLHTLVVVKLY